MPSVYPGTILGFFTYIIVAMPYITINATRLGVSPARLLILGALYGDVDTVDTYLYYKALWDDETGARTKAVKNGLRKKTKELQAELSITYNDIPASKWTDNDRDKLNRKTGIKASKTVPTEQISDPCIPDATVFPLGIFHFGTRSRFDKKHYAVPETANMVEIAYAVVEGRRKIDETTDKKVLKSCSIPSETNCHDSSTTAKFKLNIDPSLAGFDVKYFVRWTNTHHKHLAGDWNGPFTLTIA